MLVNQSMKASLDKSLQLLVLSAIAIGLAGLDPVSAQAPVTGATPATAATPAPATSATPSAVPYPGIIKPGINAYNGSSASTLELPNSPPSAKEKAKGAVYDWKIISVVEANHSYTIDVKYPQFDPIKGSDPSKLNEEIKRYVYAQIDAARTVMPARMKHIEGPKPLSYIKGVFNVSIYNQHLCSMTVDLTSYAFQSAHPVEALSTFNYRLDTNQQFALKDVFRPNFKYIPMLSKICISRLTEGLDDEGADWVRRGAAPQEKNFVKFQITPSHLDIVFEPYTIDNGSDGYRTVPIVWDGFRANVSTDVPFHKLVSH